MGVKHPKPHKAIEHKTHHKEGYRKPLKKPTMNAAPDVHKRFCKRCYAFNGLCLNTNSKAVDNKCGI